jgi:tetratricopeptide (TPR) repeat protein
MKEEQRVEQLIRSARGYLKEQDFEKALTALLSAYEMDREHPDTLYLLGITYTRIGKYESALYNFEQLLESDISYINRVHTEMVTGYIYTILEEHDKALAIFRGIVDAGFESAQVFAAIGYIMDRKGDFKKACMNLYRAIDLEEALEEIKKAVSLDKNNPAYLDSLGWVYYKLGKTTQARSYLKKASQMAPDNEEIKTHLAVVQKSSPA